MPTVEFRGESIDCERGAVLRDVLLAAGVSPHNGPRAVSCHSLGTCGTCAVAIEGEVSPRVPEGREAWRLDFSPHDSESGLRLACQVCVESDLVVEKFDGFWGQYK